MSAGLYTDAEVGVFAEWLGIGPDAAKRVLDIVAPAIAARALRDAAEWLDAASDDQGGLYAGDCTGMMLDRADELERTH